MLSSQEENEITNVKSVEVAKILTISEDRTDNRCEICSKSFVSRNLLQTHFEFDHKNYLAAKQNIQAQKTYALEQGLVYHKKAVHDIKCENCGKGFSSKGKLKRHILEVHEKIKDFKCIFCTLAFARRSELKNHIGNKHSDGEKETCQFCEKSVLKNLFISHFETHYKPNSQRIHEKSEREKRGDIICNTCFKTFESYEAVKIHGSSEHGLDQSKLLKCHFCDKIFEANCYLNHHIMAVHALMNQIKCKKCDKPFIANGSLKKHMLNVHQGGNKSTCEHCNKVYKSHKTLLRHTREVHENRRSHKCDICEETFKRPVHLTEHVANAHQLENQSQVGNKVPEDLKCEACNESFNTRSEFKEHVKRVHERRKTQSCNVCSKTFMPSSLYLHLRNVHKSSTFKCKICEKVFSSKNYLKDHIDEIHRMAEKYFKCSQCDKSFFKNSQLKDHQRIVHNKRLTYNCTECQKMFHSFRKYNDHKIIKHTEEWKDKIICMSCERIFLSKAQLTFHDRTIHNLSKNFDCDICGKTFSKLRNLEDPKTFVHGMKSLRQKCDTCGKLFPTKGYLNSHIKRYHEKGDFSCNICKLKFTCRNNLKTHFRSEHNENRYNCMDCNQSFKVARTLDNHYLKAHKTSTTVRMLSNDIEIENQEVTDELISGENIENFEQQSIEDIEVTKEELPETDPLEIKLGIKSEPIEIYPDPLTFLVANKLEPTDTK